MHTACRTGRKLTFLSLKLTFLSCLTGVNVSYREGCPYTHLPPAKTHGIYVTVYGVSYREGPLLRVKGKISTVYPHTVCMDCHSGSPCAGRVTASSGGGGGAESQTFSMRALSVRHAICYVQSVSYREGCPYFTGRGVHTRTPLAVRSANLACRGVCISVGQAPIFV
jgi:hypothetical protein